MERSERSVLTLLKNLYLIVQLNMMSQWIFVPFIHLRNSEGGRVQLGNLFRGHRFPYWTGRIRSQHIPSNQLV